MKLNKRTFLFLALFFAISAGSSWAAVIGSTNAADFSDPVDWCNFTDCPATPFDLGTSAAWTSLAGSTGAISFANVNGASLSLFQQGFNWAGNFADAMGVVYTNGTADDLLLTFDQAQTGIGAYIQASYPGPFTATIRLYDVNDVLLGSYTTSGTSDDNVGTALFIGATSTDPVWFVQFSATGTGPSEPDFAIGRMGLNVPAACTGEIEDGVCVGGGDTEDDVPEPASLLLMAPALLGLVAIARRR